MRIVIILAFVFSSAFGSDCISLVLKLHDPLLAQIRHPQLIEIDYQIDELSTYYRKLDEKWDRLDSQGLIEQQRKVGYEMESVATKIEELQARKVYLEEILPGKEALLNRIRALAESAD